MAIPKQQQIEAKSKSFRRPIWSTQAVPDRAPMSDVTELTRLSTR